MFRPGSRNYCADMTVLTVGRFAGLGVGIIPKDSTGLRRRVSKCLTVRQVDEL
jgi:hypothetical protein